MQVCLIQCCSIVLRSGTNSTTANLSHVQYSCHDLLLIKISMLSDCIKIWYICVFGYLTSHLYYQISILLAWRLLIGQDIFQLLFCCTDFIQTSFQMYFWLHIPFGGLSNNQPYFKLHFFSSPPQIYTGFQHFSFVDLYFFSFFYISRCLIILGENCG